MEIKVIPLYEHNRFGIEHAENEWCLKKAGSKSKNENPNNEINNQDDLDEQNDTFIEGFENLSFTTDISEILKKVDRSNYRKNKIEEIRALGISYNHYTDLYSASYYIGVDWLDEQNDLAIMVRPKLETKDIKINFQKMFMDCFDDADISKAHSLDELFHIHTDKKFISLDKEDFSVNVEPLLIIAFLESVRQIIRMGGLRKDYIQKEEDLAGKIKGKVVFSKFIKKDIARERKNNVFCRFQEYGVDCLDNRLLKCAMLMCRKNISNHSKQWGSNGAGISRLLNYCLPPFESVSAEITKQEIRQIRINPLYKNYKTAIQLAKLIVDKKSHLITRNSKGKEQVFVPPFIIDMPLLFERYVYHLLHRAYDENVKFQVSTYGSKMDFCKADEKLIIDTKYKPQWKDSIDHSNVRQLAGYARQLAFRDNYLSASSTDICPCLIIYPDMEKGIDSFKSKELLLKNDEITGIDKYLEFYKVGIKLPSKNVNVESINNHGIS